ncbi:hypothetical protein BKA56DRAFT_681189 [Ilyonectria sp. MPI-CAGE-AT-0026]|nr:hypothetical protein BKA56DRAFT_681189 [Ilyonectria sp. MPI-CAGE-AT-0026]
MPNIAIEIFVLLSIGLGLLGMRICVRLDTSHGRKLALDDYLMVLVAPLYLVEMALAYAVRSHLGGLANHGSEEHELQVLGSQIYLAEWVVHVSLLRMLKAAACTHCLRLARDLGTYREPAYAGLAFVFITWIVAFLSVMLGCRPLSRSRQISPDPGNNCQPAVSKIDLLATTVLNELTNDYLPCIVLLMLPYMRLSSLKKLEFAAVSVCGAFVMAAGILRCALTLTNRSSDIEQAERWAVREAFGAITTVNLPIIFSFFVEGRGLQRKRACPRAMPDTPHSNPPFFPNDGGIWVTSEVGVESVERQSSVSCGERSHECVCQTPDNAKGRYTHDIVH